MGFFDDLGEGLFGTSSKAAGKAGAAAAGATAATAATDAAGVGTEAGKENTYATGQEKSYDKGAAASMGSNATQYMQKANAAAQTGAAQAGQAVATGANRQQLQAARTSGMNKAQAAQMGGQAGGNAYTNVYQNQLASGQNQYQNATQQFASQGNQMAGRANAAQQTQLGAANAETAASGAQTSAASAQYGQGADTSKQTWSALSGIAGAIASDARVKNISPMPTGATPVTPKQYGPAYPGSIDEILAKVRPISYTYKKGVPGTDQQPRVGVTAQDLEGTALAPAVKTDPNTGIKQIDSAELSPMLLNLIIQLARKVESQGGK